MPTAAISSSAWTMAKVALPVSLSMRCRRIRSMSDSHSEEDGVIGYHATTVTPAIRQPMAAAWLPSIRILPLGLVHALGAEAGLLAKRRLGVVEPGLERGHVQRQRLLLLRQLLGERLLHLAQLDVEQVRQRAVVDHVAHQAAQLGVGADGGDQLVERHRVERQVGPQRLQVQRLVVDHAGAGLERQHVLARRLDVHRDQEIDLLLAGDVAVLVGADGVPGRQAGDVGRETGSCPRPGSPSGTATG